jgi:LysM repeat protein
MLLNTKNCLSIALLLLFLFSLTTQAKTLWQDNSGKLHFRWTTDDIVVTNGQDKPIFSAQQVAQTRFTADFLPATTFKVCEYQRELKLLSVVDTIASFAQAERVNCQNSPQASLEIQMYSLDMASGQPVNLTDFFSEATLLTAFLNDAVVKKALAGSEVKNPTTLAELYEALQWADITIKECDYYLPANYLSQFAFHHLRKNQVAIRVNLPLVNHSCQGDNLFIAFYLPIPTSLKTALKQASFRKAGFLMSAQEKVANGETTMIRLYTHKQFDTIRVQSGDTLYGLAVRYDSTLDELATLNNLSSPDLLQIGQVLTIAKPQYSWQWDYTTTIHPELPSFTFILQGEPETERSKTGATIPVKIKMIEIQKAKQSQPFQLITTDAKPTITPATAETKVDIAFHVEDLNFDGYRDLRLMVEPVDTNQAKYAYWLYDPRRGRFVANEALSAISSPEVEVENQQIKSFWRDSASHYGMDIYQWLKEQPVLVQQEERLYTDEGLKVVMKKRINGEMKVVSETFYQEEEETQSGQMKSLAAESASSHYRIINAFGLDCYSAPSLSARSVATLPFGTVVKQLARSDFQEPLGQVHDYWYKIELPTTGEVVGKGWIFGGYSLPLEPQQRAQVYQKMAQAQLQKSLNLPAQKELIDFLARAQQEIYTAPDIIAELALLQLLALEKMLAQLPGNQTDELPYQDWLEIQQKQGFIDYDVQSEKWQVKPQAFWHLHEQYYPLPITERIAWMMANQPVNEECQNFFCQLQQLEDHLLKYLKYHPQGEYRIVATTKIKEILAHYASQQSLLADDQVMGNVEKKKWLTQLMILRAIVARTQFPAKDEMMQALDKLTALIK